MNKKLHIIKHALLLPVLGLLQPNAVLYGNSRKIGAPDGFTQPEYLFLQQSIRDTLTAWPRTLINSRVVNGRTFFTVRNGLNQSITLTFIGDMYNNPSAADIGGATVLASSSSTTIATNVWAPWIGLRIVAASNPSSGTVDVLGATEQVAFGSGMA